MKKLIYLILLSVTFGSLIHTSFFLPTKMSKPSVSSLLSQVTELTTQFAALSARLDTLIAAKPASASASTPEKKKRAKKEKDPDAPKRAPGAYILFCQAERAKTPDVKLLVTELAERWRALSDEQRASYKPAVSAAAPASAETKPSFQEARDVAAKMNSSLASKFLRFCIQNPTLDAKTAEARFKALSPEQKAKFNDAGDDTSDAGDDSSDVDSSYAE